MTVSLQEQLTLTCPQCGTPAAHAVWLIVDADEQPAAVALLEQARLNRVTCPHCGHEFGAPTPLLLHDLPHRRVVFVPPAGVDELTWRDMAYELHALLVGSIALEQRQLYLGDMQIAQDQAGLAQLLAKQRRRSTGGTPAFGKPISSVLGDGPLPAALDVPPPPPRLPTDPDALLLTIQQLLDADSPAAMEQVVQQHPELLTQQAHTALEELADLAVEQREYAAADLLHRARVWLLGYQTGMTPVAHAVLADAPAATPTSLTAEHQHHLLAASNPGELWQVVQQFPELQEPWVDAALTDLSEQYASEGNARLASQLEERRTALLQLLAAPPPPDAGDPLQDALEALLTAPDQAALTQILIDYPELLTDAAQTALQSLARDARASDDEELAAYALECRAMLQQVCAGLHSEGMG